MVVSDSSSLISTNKTVVDLSGIQTEMDFHHEDTRIKLRSFTALNDTSTTHGQRKAAI